MIIREPEATGKTVLQPSFCSSKGRQGHEYLIVKEVCTGQSSVIPF